MLYRTVPTPSNLPPHGKFDGLAVLVEIEGQRPVSEAKPGDRDYSGGRWQVYLFELTEEGRGGLDADGDGKIDSELTSWEMVQAHVEMEHLALAGMGPRFVSAH